MPDPAQPIRRPVEPDDVGVLPTLVVIGVVLVTFGLFTNFWTDSCGTARSTSAACSPPS